MAKQAAKARNAAAASPSTSAVATKELESAHFPLSSLHLDGGAREEVDADVVFGLVEAAKNGRILLGLPSGWAAATIILGPRTLGW
jgi:hypothetical protein